MFPRNFIRIQSIESINHNGGTEQPKLPIKQLSKAQLGLHDYIRTKLTIALRFFSLFFIHHSFRQSY